MKQGNARLKTNRFFCGIVLIVCVLVSPLGSAEVYKWVDENGVTHYSQTPPPSNQEAEIQDVPETDARMDEGIPVNDNLSGFDTDDEGLSAADRQRQQLADAAAARAQDRQATEALCRETQRQLDELEPNRRVFYTDENGETVRMDDEERVAAVERLHKLLETDCP